MNKDAIFFRATRFVALAMLTIFGFISIIATGGSKVETNRIDCDVSTVTITSTLVGTVSDSGDTVTGNLTITCGTNGIRGVTITGSAGWWNIVSVGPSNASGVIAVAKSAEALGRSDIGTTKTVPIIVNGYDASGNEASRTITISIPIN